MFPPYKPIPFRVPRFYPILDTITLAERECPVIVAARTLLDVGAKVLQYRHKDAWTQAHFDEAKQIATLCHDRGVLFVLNDRADFARLLGAALHIGQDDLIPAAARVVVSDEVIGFSTHNEEQLKWADEERIEYVSVGPIFGTNSKSRPDPVVGLEGLRRLRTFTQKPLVAIGGITLENALEVLGTGADSVAVISSLLPGTYNQSRMRRRAEEWMQLVSQSR